MVLLICVRLTGCFDIHNPTTTHIHFRLYRSRDCCRSTQLSGYKIGVSRMRRSSRAQAAAFRALSQITSADVPNSPSTEALTAITKLPSKTRLATCLTNSPGSAPVSCEVSAIAPVIFLWLNTTDLCSCKCACAPTTKSLIVGMTEAARMITASMRTSGARA